MTAVAARGRGLATNVASDEALAELDHVRDAAGLAAGLARAGIAVPPGATADVVERLARARVASDLAILGRWSDALEAVMLDEDRRSLRAIVRGLAAGASVERRLAGTVPTAALPAPALAELAAATQVADVAELLVRRGHPLAPALASPRDAVDLLELELALAHRFVALARSPDPALRAYLAQLIDAENTAAALILASRGHELAGERAWLAGGERLDHAAFVAAAAGPIDAARDLLARALAGTPLAGALFAVEPAALDDATLAWQLATQARLRRTSPLGLAPALYAVLRRRDEARRVRRAAWRLALGGPP